MTPTARQDARNTTNGTDTLTGFVVALASALAAVAVLLVAPRGYTATVLGAVAVAAIIVAIHDSRTERIPNAAVAAIGTFGIVEAAAAAIANGPATIGVALGSAGLTFAATAAAAAAGWTGFGDVKLLTVITMCLSVVMGWYALYLLPLALVIETMRRIVDRRRGRHPFGPSIAVATLTLTVTATFTVS